jgi:hypothetical protein
MSPDSPAPLRFSAIQGSAARSKSLETALILTGIIFNRFVLDLTPKLPFPYPFRLCFSLGERNHDIKKLLWSSLQAKEIKQPLYKVTKEVLLNWYEEMLF